jgi:hypothetical protein
MESLEAVVGDDRAQTIDGLRLEVDQRKLRHPR